jgi:LPXTG-site transpeptidase (sortase) family protein
MTSTQKREAAAKNRLLGVLAILLVLWGSEAVATVMQDVTAYSTEAFDFGSEPDTRMLTEENIRHAAAPEEKEELSTAIGLNPDLDRWEITERYRLSIPSLDVRAPVQWPSRRFWNSAEWTMLEEQMQIGLLHGVTAYPHSVAPGEEGALIIVGHSSPPTERAEESVFGAVFEMLPSVQIGEEIVLLVKGSAVTYRVTRKTVVPSSATDILRQESKKSILKLITCYPVGTTKNRLVVTAELVEN